MLGRSEKNTPFECGGHFPKIKCQLLADLFKNPSLKYVDGLFFL
jgi:hypothetical protein